jgi:hypothetical protein
MNKKKQFLLSYFKSLGVLLLASFAIYILLYRFDIKPIYMSNALFIPNVLVLIISFGANIGAGNIFHPLSYTALMLFNRKKSKEQYENYAEYIEYKKKDNNSYWHITVASISLLVLAYFFSIT